MADGPRYHKGPGRDWTWYTAAALALGVAVCVAVEFWLLTL